MTFADVLSSSSRFLCAQSEALAFLRTLPAGCVHLIATDPPFNIGKAEWDRWPSIPAYLAWLDEIAAEWQRVLAPNGSLYCFAAPSLAARVEVKIGERFRVLNTIRWRKPPYSTKAEMFDKDTSRSFFPASEAIIFAEHFTGDDDARDAAGYIDQCEGAKRSTFGGYLRAEMERANVSAQEVAALFPSRTGGLTGCVSNWILGLNCPTAEQWEAIRERLNRTGGEYLRKGYEELRKGYEELRRPFVVTDADPYTDTWDFPTVPQYPGKHPCEKPSDLCRHIIRASSRPGDVVLDTFAGSGAFMEAALIEGRRAIGCDFDPQWAAVATARCERALREPAQAGRPLRMERPAAGQLALLPGMTP